MPVVFLPEQNRNIAVEKGTRLLDALRKAGLYPEAACGGNGTCGKCKVLAQGREVLACKTLVQEDLTVILPQTGELRIQQQGICPTQTGVPGQEGYLLAFDIGTTSVVCFLLDGKTGRELAQSSTANPQAAFGADVISRVRAALQGEMPRLTEAIRGCMTRLIRDVCSRAGIHAEQIGIVSVVGNPAMQQLFLGMEPKNLVEIPFKPVLTEAKTLPCQDYLPVCPNGRLLVVPDISGYVGADTLGCLLATELYKQEELTLLVDIGTNGEMVLGNKDRMVACATAAGPALEGANIQWGMRASAGAIDHVWLEKGQLRYSVLGGGEAKGICGSGLVDAVAVGLEMGLLNKRGRIENGQRLLRLTERVYLTQEDIRQVQLAKGAIHAGIILMTERLGVQVEDIQKVQLAGAFGSFLDPENACRIGLLPGQLTDRIQAVGNAAGSGAKMLARDLRLLGITGTLVDKVEYLDLASQPNFARTFAGAMLFREESL